MAPVRFRYPDRVVYLAVFACAMAGTPSALDCQRVRWVKGKDLNQYRFPPADAALIRRLSTAIRLRRSRQSAII